MLLTHLQYSRESEDAVALNGDSEYYIGAMEHLWAPWRIEYLKRAPESDCFLCYNPAQNEDEANLILHRGQYNFVILNAFPYNPGHLMVAPYRHTANLHDLGDEEASEHFSILKMCLELLKEVMAPTGFNIGLNLGRVAGAGIAEHLHTHIVPRWSGDTNFMPVVSDTKVMPEALSATCRKLREKLRQSS